MQRELDEALASQDKMLRRLNQRSTSHDEMKTAFTLHLERLMQWLPEQPHLNVLVVNYNQLMNSPDQQIQRVAGFLNNGVALSLMGQAIDMTLYRNRL